MKNFDRFYRITQEVKDRAKKPFVYKKMMRGFEASIDSLESAKEDMKEKIDDLMITIANGEVENIKVLAVVQRDIDETDRQIDIIKMALAEMNAEAPKEEKAKE